jgi:hypothetical protein
MEAAADDAERDGDEDDDCRCASDVGIYPIISQRRSATRDAGKPREIVEALLERWDLEPVTRILELSDHPRARTLSDARRCGCAGGQSECAEARALCSSSSPGAA